VFYAASFYGDWATMANAQTVQRRANCFYVKEEALSNGWLSLQDRPRLNVIDNGEVMAAMNACSFYPLS